MRQREKMLTIPLAILRAIIIAFILYMLNNLVTLQTLCVSFSYLGRAASLRIVMSQTNVLVPS